MNDKDMRCYKDLENWDSYCHDILWEYKQCIDEGLDIEKYEAMFECAATLPRDETRKSFTDALFEAVNKAKIIEGYKYNEPSDLKGIKALRKPYNFNKTPVSEEVLKNKIHGAWMGRICGCLLGKPVEGIRSEEMLPLLKESRNYPMHRYILSTDVTEEMYNNFSFNLHNKCFADTVHGMPVDDDTNYIALAQCIIEDFGREFTPENVAFSWVKYQSREAYFTAERVAYRNYINGYHPPYSATYKNPYREWIGAQIRGDYFGYINPGEPEKAAEMAFRDACISHTKNGIYGEMWATAMVACAAVTDDIEAIIRGGLAQIPETSRLYESIDGVIDDCKAGVSYDDCISKIHTLFDEHTGYGWCHTIPNAMIVTAALMYGNGDFGKSICMAVQPCFDTDCNGATVGSVLGMRNGLDKIDEYWKKPVENTLHTSIFGVGTAEISTLVEKTFKHLK